jgi:hypothetical protein
MVANDFINVPVSGTITIPSNLNASYPVTNATFTTTSNAPATLTFNGLSNFLNGVSITLSSFTVNLSFLGSFPNTINQLPVFDIDSIQIIELTSNNVIAIVQFFMFGFVLVNYVNGNPLITAMSATFYGTLTYTGFGLANILTFPEPNLCSPLNESYTSFTNAVKSVLNKYGSSLVDYSVLDAIVEIPNRLLFMLAKFNNICNQSSEEECDKQPSNVVTKLANLVDTLTSVFKKFAPGTTVGLLPKSNNINLLLTTQNVLGQLELLSNCNVECRESESSSEVCNPCNGGGGNNTLDKQIENITNALNNINTTINTFKGQLDEQKSEMKMICKALVKEKLKK